MIFERIQNRSKFLLKIPFITYEFLEEIAQILSKRKKYCQNSFLYYFYYFLFSLTVLSFGTCQ